MTVSLAFTFVGGNNQGVGAGSDTITLSTEGGVDVITQGYTKDIKVRTRGKGGDNADEAPETYVFDFKQGVVSYYITGILQDTSGGDEAETKKNKLIAMGEEGNPNDNTISFTWSDGLTGTKTVFIRRLSFRQVSGTPVYFYYEIELVEGKIRS